MTKEPADLLATVVTEILEQFAFMFADMADPGKEPECPDCIRAHMTYTAPDEKGRIEILASAGLCAEMAANVLGLEHDMPAKADEDTIKELLNIVCGRLTYNLYGETVMCDLGIPSIAHATTAEWKTALRSPQAVRLTVEGRPFIALLSTHKQAKKNS